MPSSPDEYTDLDSLWIKNNNSHGFFVIAKTDVFQTPVQINGKTSDSPIYDKDLYWVGNRLIKREDCLRKIWKQVPPPK